MGRLKKGEETGINRNNVPIPLTPEANRLINEWCEKSNSSKSKFVQRLMEWFAAAPDSMKHIATGMVAEDMRVEYAKKSADYFESFIKVGRVAEAEAPASEGATTEGRASPGAAGGRRSPRNGRAIVKESGREEEPDVQDVD